MKVALVTGATGFVGRHVLDPLVGRGFEVHAVTSRVPPEDAPGVWWHRADLLAEPAATALVARVRPSHLLHLAWDVTPGAFWTSPHNRDWQAAGVPLARAFAAHGGRRLVAAGTCAEYDWTVEREALEEDEAPLRPETPYGAAKHELHGELAALGRRHGIGVAWGRIFFLYGPGEPASRLVPSVVRALLARQPAPCSHGDQVRDFLHVQDVAGAFAALLDADVTGAVNIGSGTPVTVREVVARLAAMLDGRDLVQWGALPASGPARLVAGTRRLRGELGWTPSVTLDDGLRSTVAWWRSRA